MDGLGIRVLGLEWHNSFGGGRIDKIHQPNAQELVLTVRANGQTSRLLLSAHKQFARAHSLRTVKPANPVEPPMFCMLLRRRIEGGRILSIRQPDWERILHIHIAAQDELGDPAYYLLILEVMGKHSNLIFCHATEEGMPLTVVDSVVHVTPDMSRVRQILPGIKYVGPPPQEGKVSVYDLSQDVIALAFEQSKSEKAFARALMTYVHGLGPDTAKEAIRRAAVGAQRGQQILTDAFSHLKTWPLEQAAAAIAYALGDLFNRTETKQESPSIGRNDMGYVEAAAPFSISFTPRTEELSSFDECIEQLYEETSRRSQVTAAFQEIEQAVLTHLDRLRGKSVKLTEQRVESEDIEEPRIKGELLMAYSYQVAKGASSAELPNFYDENRPMVIELDPALSATANATQYFKQASKRKRAIPILEEELLRTKGDIEYLESVLATLNQVDGSLYPSIRSELEKQGFIRAKNVSKGHHKQGNKRKESPKQKREDIGRPDEYWSCDGHRIRVGRNNLQNDRLTLRTSRPSDIWLHVKDAPGSHVVIESGDGPVPHSTIEEAALLAAYFSKARIGSNVPVDWTEIKNVWKPNGARPGHVLYESQRTLYATPDKALIDVIVGRQGDE